MSTLDEIKILLREGKYAEVRNLMRTLDDEAVIRVIERRLEELEKAQMLLPIELPDLDDLAKHKGIDTIETNL